MRRILPLLLVLAAGCGEGPSGTSPAGRGDIAITSTAFREGGTIPVAHSCDGDNLSPPLSWSGVPGTAAELAVVVRDLDAGGFVHWILLGILPSATGLEAGTVPPGTVQGTNGFGSTGYGGPCPPDGERHRYEFTVYALRQTPGLGAGASIEEVETAVSGATLGFGTITASYGGE